jgi:hypothetical protein
LGCWLLPVEPQLGSRNVYGGRVPAAAAAWKSVNFPKCWPAAVLMSVKVVLVSGSAS